MQKRYTIDEIYTRNDKKEKRRKIISSIIYAFLIPLLIYNVIIVYQMVSSGDKIPSIFGYKTFVIVSGSMLPELEIGDIVIVKETEQKELKTGDVISFREGNAIVTHRIVEIKNDDGIKYITKGDANNANDVNPVKYSNVEGEFVTKIPKIGSAVIFMQNKVGICVIGIFIYIIYARNKNRQEDIQMRKEKRKIYDSLQNNKK